MGLLHAASSLLQIASSVKVAQYLAGGKFLNYQLIGLHDDAGALCLVLEQNHVAFADQSPFIVHLISFLSPWPQNRNDHYSRTARKIKNKRQTISAIFAFYSTTGESSVILAARRINSRNQAINSLGRREHFPFQTNADLNLAPRPAPTFKIKMLAQF